MKHFKTTIIGLVCHLGLLHSVAAAIEQDSLNIAQLLTQVDKNSREIKISQSTSQVKETLIQDAKLQRLPNFSVFAEVDKASNMPIYTNGLFNKPEQHDVIHTLYQSGANLYLNIYSGLKNKNLIEIAKLDKEFADAELNEKTATIKLKAIHLFYDLYLQRSWIEIIKADIEEKKHQAEEIKHLYSKGVILESDVIRAELEISKRKMTLLEIENDIKVINQQLNVLIGQPDNFIIYPQVKLDQLNTNTSLEQVINEGLKNAYSEKTSGIAVHLAEKQVDMVKSNSAIQLGLTGSLQYSNPQIFLYPYNANWYALGIIGLKASYNISSLYHNSKKITASKIEANTAHIHHQKIQDDVRTKLFEAYHNYQEAQEYIAIRTQNVQYAEENMRIIKNAYFSQSSLITDLLDANVLTLKAKFELKQAHINIYKTYYSLAFAKGNL